jgi:5-methylcytosine-specific restriction endonuclease McrA
MSLNRLVLVLNASYEAVNIVAARRAMRLLCKGAAVLEAPSAYFIHTSQISIQLPSVIRLVRYRRVPRFNRSVSRKGIILRDRSTCQYCGGVLPNKDLTLDHVTPRSRGGQSTWENLVAACFGCNNEKADRTPSEAGMPLSRRPLAIGIHAKVRLMQGDEGVWDKYLFAS